MSVPSSIFPSIIIIIIIMIETDNYLLMAISQPGKGSAPAATNMLPSVWMSPFAAEEREGKGRKGMEESTLAPYSFVSRGETKKTKASGSQDKIKRFCYKF
jgi:hypothetical protein